MGRLLDRARRHVAFALGDEPPEVEASLDSVTFPTVAAAISSNREARALGVYSRDVAMSVPTVKRARNLHCSLVGSLPITYWRAGRVGEDPTEVEPLTWMDRPDPAKTRPWILAWTVDDLLFWGRAYWQVTGRQGRNNDGFPTSFKLLQANDVHVNAVGDVRVMGEVIPPADLVEFRSTTDGILGVGSRVIRTALKLEAAADRYAEVDIPAGFLQEEDGPDEPMSPEDALDWVTQWHTARLARTTGFVPRGLTFKESTSNPERLQLVEARQHSALELAREMDVPPWTVGAPTNNSLTYTNGQQARADLIDFGTRQFIDVIEATLSGPNVTPRGTFVRLDKSSWLENPFNEGTPSGADQNRSEDSP